LVIFHFRLVKLPYQIEEEVGSAEEQPTSNRFDVHTKNEGSSICPFLCIFWCTQWLKKTYFLL